MNSVTLYKATELNRRPIITTIVPIYCRLQTAKMNSITRKTPFIIICRQNRQLNKKNKTHDDSYTVF